MQLATFWPLIATLAFAPGAFAQSAVAPGPSAPTLEWAEDTDVLPVDPDTMNEMEVLQRSAFERHGPLGVVTLGMNRHEIIVLCHTIAQNFASFAAAETRADARNARFGEVWRFEQRLTQPVAQARQALGEGGYSRALSLSGQSMSLLSMMPDPLVERDTRSENDLMFGWITGLATRCDQMLDDMGIASISGDPPQEYFEEKTRFRFRGADYAEIFAGTGLGPFAEEMCRGSAVPDFAAAPLDQRGIEGMSLLDWAIECDDRASFDALIAAGFDLDAKGLWEDPPLVRTASEKRLWFLARLLDAGVNPDTLGKRESALMAANSDLDAINYGGDARAAFDLLRERGASLNFPNFQQSMWQRWGLHETRWDLILDHWPEFESDPVELASLLEFYLSGDMNWARREYLGAAQEVRARLIGEHGVCFPVGQTFEMEADARGFRIQPDCPRDN